MLVLGNVVELQSMSLRSFSLRLTTFVRFQVVYRLTSEGTERLYIYDGTIFLQRPNFLVYVCLSTNNQLTNAVFCFVNG